uniref:Uncharacterized protein n=1 Tax=Micrurus corallinus TaxID=54390 RepID=A0A2D4FYA7_MICCO
MILNSNCMSRLGCGCNQNPGLMPGGYDNANEPKFKINPRKTESLFSVINLRSSILVLPLAVNKIALLLKKQVPRYRGGCSGIQGFLLEEQIDATAKDAFAQFQLV